MGFQPSHGGVGCGNHPQYVPFSMSKGWVSEAPHHPHPRTIETSPVFLSCSAIEGAASGERVEKAKIAGQAKDTS